jgi:uncharacterized protein involved in type VI secretion and phage assembly
VWVEFEEGDPNRPIWTGCLLKNSEPHTEAKDGSPKVRSWKTEENLRISLDDNVKEVQIHLADSTKIIMKQEDEKIIIDAENIELGEGATEAIVLGDALTSLFNSHTHPYVDKHTGGPTYSNTSPPNQQMGGSHISAKHKVE